MRVEPEKKFNLSLKNVLRKGSWAAAIFFGLEAAGLLGSYVFWRKMNRDQDFRFKVHEKAPYALEYYYKIGEKLGGSSCREDDEKAWGIKIS